MQPSLQDVQKPFDPTGYASISGAQLGQLADGISPFGDKGLNVVTTDVAGVPQVPDGNGNPKWQNYTWIRRQVNTVAAYLWNPGAASDPTFLNWVSINLAALADGSVTNSKLAAGSVTNDKIFSVDWTKITSIPASLLLSGSAAGGDLTGTYPNPTIVANAITATKLQSDPALDANRAVGTNHIQSQSVTAAKLDPVTVTGFLVPSGCVTQYAGSAAPSGWLECNGALISRATFSALFTAIGTNYGAGDGSTTFQLPDMRGYFPRGWDHGAGVDTGRTLGSTQQDKMKDHKHNPLSGTHFVTDSGTGSTGGAGALANTDATTGLINGADGTGTETRPKNVSFMFIIKS